MPANATGATGQGQSLSLSGLPFTFNPPIHPSLMHVNPVSGSDTHAQFSAAMASIYDETAGRYEASAVNSAFGGLRLGRFVMGKDALSFALKSAGTRYGFRFLYNPTSMSGGTSVNTDWIPDPTNTVTAVLQEGLETFTFELLLNRVPEVMGGVQTSDYQTAMSAEDLKQIQERGTHYDLEFLYRICNGVHNTKARKGTGDIGILLPNPCELFLGPYRSRGAIQSINVVDKMFSPEMVPVLTFVTITFMRFLTLAHTDVPAGGSPLARDGSGGGQDVVILRSSLQTSSEVNGLIALIQGSSSSLLGVAGGILGFLASQIINRDDGGTPGTGVVPGSPSAPPVAPPANGGSALSGKQVYNLALGAGFSTAQAHTMTQISNKESGWNPNAHNDGSKRRPATTEDSYGLWQINMDNKYAAGRLRDFGITTKGQLYDPATNARAAYKTWKGQGYGAWSVYSNGSYRHAPSW